MKRLKATSYHHRYLRAYQSVCTYQDQVLPFVQKRLGNAGALELSSVWLAGIAPIPEHVPDVEKYEIAYSNWLWVAKCAFELIDAQLGPDGLKQLEQLLLQALNRQVGGPQISLLRLVGDFEALAEVLLDELQWITSLELSESTSAWITCRATGCKVLSTPGMEQVCRLGCYHLYSRWAAEQLKLRLQHESLDHGCSMTIRRLGD